MERYIPNDKDPEKEIDSQDFYVEFGFKHRTTAEGAFISDVSFIMEYGKTSNS